MKESNQESTAQGVQTEGGRADDESEDYDITCNSTCNIHYHIHKHVSNFYDWLKKIFNKIIKFCIVV